MSTLVRYLALIPMGLFFGVLGGVIGLIGGFIVGVVETVDVLFED